MDSLAGRNSADWKIKCRQQRNWRDNIAYSQCQGGMPGTKTEKKGTNMSMKNKGGLLGFIKAIFTEGRGDDRIGQGEEKPPTKVATVDVVVDKLVQAATDSARAARKASARRPDWKRPVRPKKVEITFTSGQVVMARVKRIDAVSAYLTVRGACSVVVSAKAFGPDGAVAFADLAVGQQVLARVKAWYPQNRQIVLAGVEKIVRLGKKQTANVGRRTVRPAKPDYEPLAKGTVALVDGANLLHKFEPTEATKVFRSLSDGLKAQGYEGRIYLEHRAWKFVSCHQASAADGEQFKTLCRDLEVTIVGRESDIAILQALKVVPNSVAVTKDRFDDYAKAFPELVGSSRLRGFSVTRIGGETLIAIDGLVEAIKVSEPVLEKSPVVEALPTVESEEEEFEVFGFEANTVRQRTFTMNVAPGLCGHGNVLLMKGNVKGAERCFEKMAARHRCEGYAGLAAVWSNRGNDKMAERYVQLGEKQARRLRDQRLRNRRIAAERRRVGNDCYALCT